MTEHLEFWHAHRIEEITFKDGLHVVKFRNPSNAVKIESKIAVLEVDESNVKLLNHHEWEAVDERSIYHSKIFDYVNDKYPMSVPMFASSHKTSHGHHYEASYLNDHEVYAKIYLVYS